MEADSWSRLFSASSKRHQLCPQSRYGEPSGQYLFPSLLRFRGFEILSLLFWVFVGIDLYLGSEEVDGIEEDPRAEFSCPFCAEDFDIVGLCCHIDDEHPQEAKSGVCFFFSDL